MEKQIIADLRKKFEIFRIFEVSWKEENFALNLARFYGKKLPKGCKKEKETGAGAFKVCLVYDNNPQYADGKTQTLSKANRIIVSLPAAGTWCMPATTLPKPTKTCCFCSAKPSKTWNRKAAGGNLRRQARPGRLPRVGQSSAGAGHREKNSLYPGKSL